ncbi:hypothetical protein [Neisseria elongata]|uniref:hypothetical protein n=1 Tax=Neisseria elongata TaxID=495 RepID=UPI0024B0B980|nr:hypothetical protein [Neisseria elongata]
MKKILLFFALFNVAAGWYFLRQPASLPLMRAADGSRIYPQSAGSGDLHLLAFAFLGFSFAALMQLSPRNIAAAAYAANLAILWAACALVSLDNGLWAAAESGYPQPLLAVVVASLPALLALFAILKRTSAQR